MTRQLSMEVIGSKRTCIYPDRGTDDSESPLFNPIKVWMTQPTQIGVPETEQLRFLLHLQLSQFTVPLTAKTQSTPTWWIEQVLTLLPSFCAFRSSVLILVRPRPQFQCLHVEDTFVFAIPVESSHSSILVNYHTSTGEQQRGSLITIYCSCSIGLPLPCSWIPLPVQILVELPSHGS
jgi:hypothetical protein